MNDVQGKLAKGSLENLKGLSDLLEMLRGKSNVEDSGLVQVIKGFTHPHVIGPLSSSLDGLHAMCMAMRPVFAGSSYKSLENNDEKALAERANIHFAEAQQSLFEIGGLTYTTLSRTNSSLGKIGVFTHLLNSWHEDGKLWVPPARISIVVDKHIATDLDKASEIFIGGIKSRHGYYDPARHILVAERVLKSHNGSCDDYRPGNAPITLKMNYALDGEAVYYMVHDLNP